MLLLIALETLGLKVWDSDDFAIAGLDYRFCSPPVAFSGATPP